MGLLIQESPLMVLPSLAEKIGLNEALILQQVHYWLDNKQKSGDKRTFFDGCHWVFNTYDEWQQQFPFWSTVTVRRTLKSLEGKSLLLTGNYNTMKIDKTKWYTVNYDHELLGGVISPCDQIDQSKRSKRSDGCDQIDQTNNQRLPETTTENKKPLVASKKPTQRAKYKFNDDHFKFAKYMFDCIAAMNPNHKQPNLESWANDLRLITDIDQRSYQDVSAVWEWVRKDSFWQSNILSPKKLRKQFDQLVIKMNSATDSHKQLNAFDQLEQKVNGHDQATNTIFNQQAAIGHHTKW